MLTIVPDYASGWGIARARCPICTHYTFVEGTTLVCCDVDALNFEPDGRPIHGYVLPIELYRIRSKILKAGRRQPSPETQQKVMAQQDNKCAYCDWTFGEWRMYKGQWKQVRLAWDHFIPYSVILDNPEDNWVASCKNCNGIKHAHIFKTIGEARDYIQPRLYPHLSPVQENLRDQACA